MNEQKYNTSKKIFLTQILVIFGKNAIFCLFFLNPPIFVGNRQTIEKFGKIDTIGSQWTRPGNFVGNGPFTLEEWKLNKVLKVKKNKLYWNADKVKLNEIHFFPVDNAS